MRRRELRRVARRDARPGRRVDDARARRVRRRVRRRFRRRVRRHGDDDPIARERLKAERSTVVDAVLPAYQSLSQKISQRDKLVVDAHLESLFELQRRIQLNTMCQPPERPLAGVYNPASDNIVYSNPKGPYEDHVDVLARALACDLTRVATFTFENSRAQPNAILPGYEGIIGSADCHELTHTNHNNAEGVEVLKQLCIHNVKLLARFLTILDETIDIDGRTVLDNTCVLNVSELLTGLHDMVPEQKWGYSNREDSSVAPDTRPVGLPLFYVGGLGGALKTNLHVDCTRANPYGTSLGKYSHNELYLTVARAMGVDEAQMPSFGEIECCNRLVDEIRV
ncbi:MAG: DUF1552 domain-containing protein [Proteobacteria bacterium]|nr:MAG: DUF1552 domain-containing protein [Pseudomonadota bacterium]